MRIIGNIILSFFISTFAYCANIDVSKTQIVKGEEVVFSISANGKDVKFPDISNIDDIQVQSGEVGQSSYKETKIINGKMTNKNTITQTKSYVFYPDKSVTIPVMTIQVDGKEQYTKPVHIEVLNQSDMKNKIPYSVDLSVDKNEIFVTQSLKLKITLKIDERLKPQDLRLGFDELSDFWQEKEPIKNTFQSNGYNIHELTYYISPLKDGNITIKPARISIGFASKYNDIFSSFMGNNLEYKTIASNSLKLRVKPLPDDAQAVGDFSLNVSVDKNETDANKPINLNIQIQGKGNLNSIKGFKPDIKGVVSYEDKPNISSDTSDGVFKSKFSQKIALVSSSDFVIPAFSFTYLDAVSKQIKTIKSEQINIKINNAKILKSQIITPKMQNTQTKQVVKEVVKTNYTYVLLAFILGLVLGFLANKIKLNKAKKLNIFKSDKELLREILIHKGKDKKLDEIILKLEENIYKNAKNKIDKKEIKKILAIILS